MSRGITPAVPPLDCSPVRKDYAMRFEVDMAPLPYILHSAGTTVTERSPCEKGLLTTGVERLWLDPRQGGGGPAR
jgi:hypothetical protein